MKHALILVVSLCTFPFVAFGATGAFASRLSPDEEQGESLESLSLRGDAYQGMYAIFTGNAMAVPLAVAQSRLQASRAGVYDQMSALTLRVRGNAGETLMSHFYVAEGWSQVPGQTGPHGIDGLFVRRGPGGGVVKFQVVDSRLADLLCKKPRMAGSLAQNGLEIIS